MNIEHSTSNIQHRREERNRYRYRFRPRWRGGAEQRVGVWGEERWPLRQAQGKPFDSAQDKPFDALRPFGRLKAGLLRVACNGTRGCGGVGGTTPTAGGRRVPETAEHRTLNIEHPTSKGGEESIPIPTPTARGSGRECGGMGGGGDNGDETEGAGSPSTGSSGSGQGMPAVRQRRMNVEHSTSNIQHRTEERNRYRYRCRFRPRRRGGAKQRVRVWGEERWPLRQAQGRQVPMPVQRRGKPSHRVI